MPLSRAYKPHNTAPQTSHLEMQMSSAHLSNLLQGFSDEDVFHLVVLYK